MTKIGRVRNPTKMARCSGKFSWFDMNWVKANAQVKQLQMCIAVAYKNGDMVKVTNAS
jgi:hypothetical protein